MKPQTISNKIFCEKCKVGAPVIDTVFNPKENSFYRKRKCPKCKKIFFTIEFIVENDDDLAKHEWLEYHRKAKGRKEKSSRPAN